LTLAFNAGRSPWAAEVGPALAAATPRPNRIWRALETSITISGGRVTAAADPNVTVSPERIQVGLQPVWMQSPSGRASRPAGTDVSHIVVHETGGTRASSALNTWVNPSSQVATHYLIDTDGQIIKVVHESESAWHAGHSHWGGRDDVNHFSVGIELVHRVGPYHNAQYDSLVALLRRIHTAYPAMRVQAIVGHSDIATSRPPFAHPRRLGRKSSDPGLDFDWPRLESHGLGMQVRVGPQPPQMIYGGFFDAVADGRLRRHDNDANHVYGGEERPAITAAVIDELQRDLSGIGYFCPISGRYDEPTRWAVQMFQEHFFGGSRIPTDPAFRRGQVDFSTATMIKSVG
jgi:N-acetyl-anhydromuramyl-L-alanine amidase AmpD